MIHFIIVAVPPDSGVSFSECPKLKELMLGAINSFVSREGGAFQSNKLCICPTMFVAEALLNKPSFCEEDDSISVHKWRFGTFLKWATGFFIKSQSKLSQESFYMHIVY